MEFNICLYKTTCGTACIVNGVAMPDNITFELQRACKGCVPYEDDDGYKVYIMQEAHLDNELVDKLKDLVLELY